MNFGTLIKRVPKFIYCSQIIIYFEIFGDYTIVKRIKKRAIPMGMFKTSFTK